MNFQPEVLFIEEGAEDFSLTHDILSRFPQIPVHRISESRSVAEEIEKKELCWTCLSAIIDGLKF